jgi:hypothetical protein
MPRLLKHPRCKDFFRASRNPMILESVTLSAKNSNLLSGNVTKILKSLRKRSFYKAIEIVSDIGNLTEQNEILQILYSATVYTENNHYANLLKLWIDDIYIKKIPNSNKFITQDSFNITYQYNVIIKLGFEYKEPPIKKEPLW